MAQITFGAATTPLETDLDLNFTELYNAVVNYSFKATAWVDDSPTVMGCNLFGNPGLAGNYLFGLGINFSFDGTNYRTAGDGSNNGAGAVLMDYASGTMEFFAFPSTGGTSQTIAPGALVPNARLTSANNFMLGQSATGYASVNAASIEGGNGRAVFSHVSGTATGALFAGFGYAGGAIGSVTQNGTTGVAYNTSSDYRLKTGVTPISGSGAFIDALKPCTWTWISDGTSGSGFIAHELQAVSPSSVTGAKDATQPIGTIKDANDVVLATGVPQPVQAVAGQTWTATGTAPAYQAVEYGSAEVVAMLVAEVQSLRARVHALDGN